ncbi:hypothetical protein CRE_05839 [Caenorhabditis remanei]|uniref:Major sperm protein n=1 Tax=Caenorhabditis remanei TaxID=31234 RepID=E3MNM0_CAERE|nr:hypothetical protein CRE_05839 [Caenorhabditis remanei]
MLAQNSFFTVLLIAKTLSDMKTLLQVTPNGELKFTRSTSGVFTASMTLKNTSSEPVCFKVKTTALKQYCVRPNTGLLSQGESQRIVVILCGEIPSVADAHTFTVLSCAPPAGNIQDFESIWENVDPSKICYCEFWTTFVEENSSSSREDGKKKRGRTVKNELTEARRELNEARREIEEIRTAHWKEVKNIRKELDDAHRELNEARKEIEESRASHSNEVTNIRQELETARADGDAARQELNDACKENEENRVAHLNDVKKIRRAKAALTAIRDITLNYEGGQGMKATRFECEICLQQFTDVAGNCAPKVLRCGHTICASCVNSLKQNNSVTCPFCRVVTSDVAEISINFYILGDNQ